jgi:hypothetical protein
VFCARIGSIDPESLDRRREHAQLTYAAVAPPAEVVDGGQDYLKRFELAYGCFEFAPTRAETPVVLECNRPASFAQLERRPPAYRAAVGFSTRALDPHRCRQHLEPLLGFVGVVRHGRQLQRR